MPGDPQRWTAAPLESDIFRCDVAHERGTARVRALGELDLATVPILESELAALRDARVEHLILDLSELEFLDLSGLRCIVAFDRTARREGFSFAIVRGQRNVQRMFEMTNTDAGLRFIG
jgi:anti-anti-sigma factor